MKAGWNMQRRRREGIRYAIVGVPVVTKKYKNFW